MPQGPQTKKRAERDEVLRKAAQERENAEMEKAAEAHLNVAGAAIARAMRALQTIRVARRSAEGLAHKRRLRAVEDASAALRRLGKGGAGRARATGPDYSDPDLNPDYSVTEPIPDPSITGPGVNG
jgi:hypothetical protein